jgi:hypothetical protein
VEVLRVLERVGEGTVAAVAEEAKMPADEVASALERLVSLNRALCQRDRAEPVYRMAARSLKA